MDTRTRHITAIGYDVDGTMVDSEPLHVAAWHETLRLNGRQFADLPPEFQATMAGRKPIAIAEFMVTALDIPLKAAEFLAQKQANFMEKVRTDLRPMPGVAESVKRLSKEYRLGIGTSLDRAYVNLILDRLGIADAFSVIVTGDEIRKGKPDPETYLVLAQRLNVRPGELVILEDAQTGIASAKAAGCWCIAIENTAAVPQDTSAADKVVGSLHEVTSELIYAVARD